MTINIFPFFLHQVFLLKLNSSLNKQQEIYMPHVAPILDFLNMTNDAGQTTDLYGHFWLYRPTFEAYHLQSEFNFLLFFFGPTGHRVNLEDFSPKKYTFQQIFRQLNKMVDRRRHFVCAICLSNLLHGKRQPGAILIILLYNLLKGF